MKKFIAVLLCVLLFSGMIPADVLSMIKLPDFSLSTEAATSGYYTYTISGSKAWIILVDSSISGSVTIPSTLDGYPVTQISDYAFNNRESITSVIIPDGVTSIGYKTFYGCSSLASIAIPSSVTSIGEEAFSGCLNLKDVYISDIKAWCEIDFADQFSTPMSYGNNLYLNGELVTELNIPYGVTSIGNFAFRLCESITAITIPDSVTSIGEMAFCGCSNLTAITIPDSVTSIGEAAFVVCTSLTSIIIPDSVTSMGNYVFQDCSNLIRITLSNSIKNIGYCAFRNCTSLTSITIPDGVISIGSSAFENCTSLISAIIPDSVTSIGLAAFKGCNNLESITLPFVGSSREANGTADAVFGYIFGYFVEEDGYGALKTDAIHQYTYKPNIMQDDYYYYYIPLSLRTVVITDTKQIPYSAFKNCHMLTSIIIPESIVSMGDSAFYYCTSLTSIIIPDGVTDIGNWIFADCKSLTSITIPNGVTSIGYDAFSGCTNLTSITIPESVTSVGMGAFDDTTWYNNKPDGLIYAGKVAYKYKGTCPSTVEIKAGTLGIAGKAFYYCGALTSIAIPGGVTNIGGDAFGYCRSLTNIKIPYSVISIGSYAFDYCSSLKYVEYTGSEKDKESIEISSSGNEELLDAEWIYNVCETEHIYSGICDDTCNNCAYTRIPTIGHIFGNACDTTCIVCGFVRTITHDWNTEYTYSDLQHWIECSVCGEKQSTPEEHTFDNACDISCDICGFVRTTTHSWNTEYTYSDLQHWIECSICREKQSIPEDHIFDNACDTTCNVCGFVRTTTHNWNTEYTYSDSQHWIECLVCGEKQSAAEDHEFDNACDTMCNICGYNRTITHDWNTEYTYSDLQHWIECLVCGEKKSVPEDHKFDNACDTMCNVCGFVRTTTHSWNTEYTYSDSQHWIECLVCGEKQSIPENHEFDNACDTSCNICDFTREIVHDWCPEYSYDSEGHWIGCFICGEKREEAENHEFDYPCDSACNICGYVREGSDHSFTINNGLTCEYCKYSARPGIPNLKLKTNNSVTLEYIDYFEYSKDGINWQESNVFTNLLPDTTYVFYQRVKASDIALQSEKSEGIGIIFKSAQESIPSAPIVINFNDTSITLMAVSGCEYSIDGIKWQDSNIFAGLSPATTYTFYQRFKETETHEASDASVGTEFTTEKGKQTLISDAPTVESVTVSSVTLVYNEIYEYSMDGKTWQESNYFDGLECGTEYTFYQRYKENDSYYAGKKSAALIAKTAKHTQSAPLAPTLQSKTHFSVTLEAKEGYEYSRDGVNWQKSNVFGGLVPEMNYLFYQRIAETDKYLASFASGYLIVKTNEFIAGDVNGDEEINSQDIVILRTNVLMASDELGFDVNEDGAVDVRDLVRAKRIAAGLGDAIKDWIDSKPTYRGGIYEMKLESDFYEDTLIIAELGISKEGEKIDGFIDMIASYSMYISFDRQYDDGLFFEIPDYEIWEGNGKRQPTREEALKIAEEKGMIIYHNSVAYYAEACAGDGDPFEDVVFSNNSMTLDAYYYNNAVIRFEYDGADKLTFTEVPTGTLDRYYITTGSVMTRVEEI